MTSISKDWVEGHEKMKKVMVFRPFEHNHGNKEVTTGSSSGPGNTEKGSQREVKKKCCILGSLSPAAWGHLRDWRLNYPSSSGRSQDQADKGRGRVKLMKGRDSSGLLRASRHLSWQTPTTQSALIG